MGRPDEGFRGFLARQCATEHGQSPGLWPLASFLTREEYEQGGWTMGSEGDILVVQAELILK